MDNNNNNNNYLDEAEQMAASVVAGLASSSGKHVRDDADDHDAAGGSALAALKKSRIVQVAAAAAAAAVAGGEEAPEEAEVGPPLSLETAAATAGDARGELRPYPFFYYQDHSTDVDADPLTPLTAPGRVPNFPAKMHAILSRSDLSEIISWQPHGRSFKVHRPRLFEANVIPTYFEHSKFSSFIRQANGWGFRRLTAGPDRNSYYHALFLRGMPFLCKTMKRPGVAKKLAADPDHEPDLYRIAELCPLPENPLVDDSILLQCTLQGGPKARMPIYSGIINKPLTDYQIKPAAVATTTSSSSAATTTFTPDLAQQQLLPHDQETLSAFSASLGAAIGGATAIPGTTSGTTPTNPLGLPNPMPFMMPTNLMVPSYHNFMLPFASPPMSFLLNNNANANTTTNNNCNNNNNKGLAALGMANQMAFGNAAALQFAAGFAAAATAMSQMVAQPPPPPPTLGSAPPVVAATSSTPARQPHAT